MVNFYVKRKQMVESQLRYSGIRNQNVLNAFLEVPRHMFVPKLKRMQSYLDGPLAIGEGQTISQPYIVAYMTQALNPGSNDRVLEIGTGSGYQTAILSQLAREVYTVEIITSLGEKAGEVLQNLNYNNINYRIGDGTFGWPEEAPFDGIIVTAAPKVLPIRLAEQLRMGGKMIIPIGDNVHDQRLVLYQKSPDPLPPGYKLSALNMLPVLFVPMTGAILNHGKKSSAA